MKHRNSKSDEQLAAILALTSDWDENKHADLTKIDYSRYKPYRSAKGEEANRRFFENMMAQAKVEIQEWNRRYSL